MCLKRVSLNSKRSYKFYRTVEFLYKNIRNQPHYIIMLNYIITINK